MADETALIPQETTDAAALMGQILDERNQLAEVESVQVPVLPDFDAPAAPIQSRELPDIPYDQPYDYSPPPMTAAEREAAADYEYEFARFKEENPVGAGYYAAAAINQVPEVLTHNFAYVLQVLGMGPEALADYSRAENIAASYLAGEQISVFDEYTQKGKELGLNELEAAGLAAIAHREIEIGYWRDSGWRKILDGWIQRIKTGNKLAASDGRRVYIKAFDAAYQRAAALRNITRGDLTPQVRLDHAGRPITGSDLMEDILRSRGHVG